MADTAKIEGVFCAACGEAVKHDDQSPRVPCPACGSVARTFDMHICEGVTIRDSFSMKAKRAGATGKHKHFIEQKSGWSLHRDSGEWRYVDQVVDRDNDRYTKRVIDQSGQVIKDVDEPLSDHFGCGDAKTKAP